MHRVISTYTLLIFAIVSMGLLAGGCSTDKDAWINKTYHNTTAKYNGYFNAGEIIKESMSEFAINRKEDYNSIIPVFEYANEEESKSLYSAMDTAAKKCESVISRHSMPSEKKGQFRKTEWCKWIDDNWLLIGQSQFYKRNFEDALKNFKYVEKQYSKESIIYSAKIWQAKTFIELGSYSKAKDLLDELLTGKAYFEDQEQQLIEAEKKAKEKAKSKSKSKRKTSSKRPTGKNDNDDEDLSPPYPKDLERIIAPIYADMLIRQKKFSEAVLKLEEAIELEKKRQFKTRLTFILAQILHRQGDQRASELYAEVVKMNPEYDMAFRAKLNRALAFSGENSRGIKSELISMLKDDKNAEYLDQIYYVLADIELRNNEQKKGVEYLELSIANSINNNEQKSKSFLRLGKLYYEEKNYIKAQQYYDSTMAVLPKTHPEYSLIETQNVSLSELVNNLNTVREKDSVLALCALPESKLIAKIEDIILNKKEEDERRKEAMENNAFLSNNGNQNVGPTSGGGVFWVWDNNLKGSGYNDFKNFWGNRILEDDWRRKDKGSSMVEDGNEENQGEKEEYTIDYYLKDLPCNDKDKLVDLENGIAEGLYNVGNIYRLKLNDEDAAKEPFLQLIDKHLPKPKAVAALYQLYLMSNSSEKEKFKNQLLNDYPDCEYSKIIKDPSFKEKEKVALEQYAKEYKTIYQQYQNAQYDQVINTTSSIIKKDTANPYICKYYYLKSLALSGKNGGADKEGLLENALQDVIDHCAGDPVYDIAKASLDELRHTVNNEKKGKYQYNEDLQHYFVLVFDNEHGNANDIKNSISDFNKASFSSFNLKTSNSFLDAARQVVLVKSFQNAAKAKDYFVAFKVNEKQVAALNKSYQYFVISNKNYAALYADKNVEEYLNFFKNNYE